MIPSAYATIEEKVVPLPKIEKPSGREYFISKSIGRAIIDYQLIQDDDRIAVAVSGGKDSLCLLKILHDRLSFVPIKYSLIAIHVDLGFHCKEATGLVDYFKSNGYDYRIEKHDIASGKKRTDINCFWCSWSRRKVLFQTAQRLGCNKLAFGHHKDDIVQTILLNLLFQGSISAMSVRQEMFGGKITIIRPLAYVEEDEIIALAKELKLPLHACVCPNSIRSKRTLVKDLIRQAEKASPHIKTNIYRSLQRIKKDYLL